MTAKLKRKKRSASSYVESIQKMTKVFFDTTGNEKATTREIATWALQTNRDAEYYNSSRQDVPPIQIYFDFNDDVEEGKFA